MSSKLEHYETAAGDQVVHYRRSNIFLFIYVLLSDLEETLTNTKTSISTSVIIPMGIKFGVCRSNIVLCTR